jgi:hypothetical protein
MITQTFTGITPERWQAIKQVMHSDAGLTIDSEDGSDSSHGINFSWLLAVPVLTVTITVPVFSWALKLAGFHCEQDVMNAFAKKIEGIPQ